MEAINNAKDAVLAFINALNHEDFNKAGTYLTDDMVFDGVLGHRDGAQAYIGDMSKMKFKYNVIKAFSEGNDVCLLYDIDMGGSDKIFTCGWYQLHDGKIKSLKVVFDPRPVLKKQ